MSDLASAPSTEPMGYASNARWCEPASDLLVFERPAWMRLGACVGLDPALFQPERGDNANISEAQAVCARCPVRQQCLDHALANKEKGIWGGTSDRQRQRMRARRRGAA